MADGAYRWFGSAPAPDAARVAQIHASYDADAAHAFGEPARATALDGIERAVVASRAGALGGEATTIADLRARVEALRPQALEPRRGLAGLFDRRARRLRSFREAFQDTAAYLADRGTALGATVDGVGRRSVALDAIWSELRDAVADLDAHVAAIPLCLTGPGVVAADGSPHPLQARTESLDACRAAALQALALIRSAQNADARTSASLKHCTDGLASWRDDWRDALGLSGKRPRRIRPDKDRLAKSRDLALAGIDRTLGELATLGVRRGEVERRLATVGASLKL